MRLVSTSTGGAVVERPVLSRHSGGDGRRSVPVDPSHAADRLVALAAHRRKLSALLRREVSFAVAALDYLLHVSPELAAPGTVEIEVLDLLDRRILENGQESLSPTPGI
jgi:hypothetical protein